MSRFVVVTQGSNLGARLVVGAEPRHVGRSADAGLRLADPAVSRLHLEIVGSDRGVHVRCLAGTTPFVVDTIARTEADLEPGQKLLVGNTVLAVGESARLAEPDLEPTDAQKLLSGLGADVRGLSSLFTLVESLSTTDDRSATLEELERWARSHLGASSTTTRSDPALAARLAPSAVAVETTGDDGPRLVVRCTVSDIVAVVFAYPARATVDEASSRLAAVAVRIFGAIVAEKEALRSARNDGAELRKMAVGSATDFLGSSPGAQKVSALVPKLAASDATVLVLGESGVGKTFVARLVHEASRRARAPLRVINCAAIPESLVESELFGHERGAFTGADATRIGAFESAGDGTLLLDEIGELPLTSQAKLLRVLEDKKFERLGSSKSIPLRARVVAATNRDLAALVEEGRFRGDLYFRVSVVTVRVPSLRERADDIQVLADRILADLVAGSARRVTGFSDGARTILRTYGWPGNVRELRNAIEHALVLGDGPVVTETDLPDSLRAVARAVAKAIPSTTATPEGADVVTLPANLEWLEQRAFEAALRVTNGNRTRAAALLGVNRATLYKKFPVGGT